MTTNTGLYTKYAVSWNMPGYVKENKLTNFVEVLQGLTLFLQFLRQELIFINL